MNQDCTAKIACKSWRQPPAEASTLGAEGKETGTLGAEEKNALELDRGILATGGKGGAGGAIDDADGIGGAGGIWLS